MTRARALWLALACIAVAYPSLSEPVLAAASEGLRWLAGEPTVLLTLAALVLAAWALRPHRTRVLEGPQS